MKKTFLFLAAMCCMMVSAQSFTITYTPQDGSPVTLSEGTQSLTGSNAGGKVTIDGNNITFDNVYFYFFNEGFKFIPSDDKTPYELNITFHSVNSLYTTKAVTCMEFMGNPSKINMKGDVLTAECNADAPAIYAHAGSIRTEVMDMKIRNNSATRYTIEMGAGEQLDIVNLESYRRVEITNDAGASHTLAREPKLSSGLNTYSQSSTVTYGTSNSQNFIPIQINGRLYLNEGCLPFFSRFVPGLKKGSVSLEKELNGGYYALTLTDVEIASVRASFLFGRDVNLRVRVKGKNTIAVNGKYFIHLTHLSNESRGNIAIEGIGNDAELGITGLLQTEYLFESDGFVSFSNLTAKLIGYEYSEVNLLWNKREGGDEEYHQLVVHDNAKLLLRHDNNKMDASHIIHGFTNLGTGLKNVFDNPVNGAFVDGQFWEDEDALTPLREVFFDADDYQITLDGWAHACSLNAEDVMRNGKVRYEDNTLIVNDYDLDNIVADNALNLSGSNSEIRAIYAKELRVTGSTNLSVLEEISAEKLTFEATDFYTEAVISDLSEAPTLIGCHAEEYDELKLEGGVLYGVKGETSEEVESLTIINDSGTGVQTSDIAVKAAKTIENGQLLILRDGKRYNAQGVEL